LPYPYRRNLSSARRLEDFARVWYSGSLSYPQVNGTDVGKG
jgi:hypothetical protein